MTEVEPVETFLAFLGAITSAAERAYGPDVIVDVFLSPPRRPDEERDIRIRLLGRSKKAEWYVLPRMLRDFSGNALDYLTHGVERLADRLRQDEA